MLWSAFIGVVVWKQSVKLSTITSSGSSALVSDTDLKDLIPRCRGAL
jgi:hypothetical protein